MIETKTIGRFTELSATTGYIHRIGSDAYSKRLIMMPSDTIDMYEEVDAIPPYTKVEYDAKVAELVRERYTEAEEFAIQRKMLNVMMSPQTLSAEGSTENIMEEYAGYNSYVQECKERAKDAELYKYDDIPIDGEE